MPATNNSSQESSSLRVLFFLRRIGPYHHARFDALADRISLTSVETRSDSIEYPWIFTANGKYKKIKFPTGINPEAGIKGDQLRHEIKAAFDDAIPEVIITTGWADHEYHAAVIEAKKRNIPCVVISDSRYEDEPRKFYKEWIKRLILKSYSAALVAGTMSTKYLLRLGFGQSKIYQPWDVVDNDHFAAVDHKSMPFKDRSFLCVSRFIKKKNLSLLVTAFAQYRKQQGVRKLIILGSGEEELTLINQIEDLGLSDSISLKGFVQYDELPIYFSKAVGLILASTTDQWGLVVNEAMASGLPVIVSNQCGSAIDLVVTDVNGYTFDAWNESQLLDQLVRLDQKTEASWLLMSAASKEMIKSWSLESFAKATEKACRYAVADPSFSNFTIIHTLLSQ